MAGVVPPVVSQPERYDARSRSGTPRSEVRVEVEERSQDWTRFAARFHEIESNVERVVRGKHREIRLALVALSPRGTC